MKLAILLVLLAGGLGARAWQATTERWQLLSERELGERWSSLRSDPDARVRRSLGKWTEVHRALLAHTPRDATIIILLSEAERTKDGILRIGDERKLLFPREVHRRATYWSVLESHPEVLDSRVFVVNRDLENGFRAQELFEEVAAGKRFTLWRYRGVQ